MCEQLGQDIDPDLIPPGFEDFPDDVQLAIVTYNRLGDRLLAEAGYLGKDWTALETHMRLLLIDNEEIFVETLLRLDEKAIKRSQEEVRRAQQKLKSKHG